jgi:hypothetical protein
MRAAAEARARTSPIQICCRSRHLPRAAARTASTQSTFGKTTASTAIAPRVEGLYPRIERWTAEKSGIAYWRSISRDNVKSIFGQSPEARIADPENPRRIFKWLLEKSTDRKGNIIGYHYKAQNQDRFDPRRSCEQNRRFSNQYLKRILYGNEVPDDERSFFFETVFDYGEHIDNRSRETAKSGLHPNAFSTFRASIEIRTYRRCLRVLMFHRFPELGTEPVARVLHRSRETTPETSPTSRRDLPSRPLCWSDFAAPPYPKGLRKRTGRCTRVAQHEFTVYYRPATTMELRGVL